MCTKGSKTYSIFTGTCPKCQGDAMYVNKNPYNIKETMKMHEHCRNCGFRYKVEPNFFFGAMFVSYAVSVFIGIIIFLMVHFIFKANLKTAFVAIFGGLIILMPIVTRLSRNIYINIFVSYDKEAGKTKQSIVKV